MWLGGSAYGASAPPDQSQNATSRRPPGSASGAATPPPWSGKPGLTTVIGLQVFPPSRDFWITTFPCLLFGLRLRPKSHVRYTVPVGPTAMKGRSPQLFLTGEGGRDTRANVVP